MKTLIRLALTLALSLTLTASAAALTLTDRSIEIEGKLDVKKANDVAEKLLKLDAKDSSPIYLMITASTGTAQAVMIVADTIQSLESAVVGIVVTQVHGTGAALAPLTDRMLIYPSAGLIFTELDYEGVEEAEEEEEGR